MRTNGWHAWVGTYTGVVFLTVAVLPLVVVTVCAMAWRRTSVGHTPTWAWRRSLTEVGIVYGTVPWVWLTLLPGSRAGRITGAVSIVPLLDLATMSTVQVVGNLLIFAAFGFLAPLRFARLASVPRITVLAAGASALIETAQYVLRLDRVSSVDDVLLNAAGGGLAALVSLACTGRTRRTEPRTRPATVGGHPARGRPDDHVPCRTVPPGPTG
jgi:glycopeptide antibiotics resistance protein